MRSGYRLRVSGFLAAAGLGAFVAGCAQRRAAERFAADHTPNNQTILITASSYGQCIAFPDFPDAPHVSASKKHRVKWVLTRVPLGSTFSIDFPGAVQPFQGQMQCTDDECVSGPARKEAAPNYFDPDYKNSISYQYTCTINPPKGSGQTPAKGDPTVMVDF